MSKHHKFSNKEEHDNFLLSALSWHASATPRILFGITMTGLYTLALAFIDLYWYPLPNLEVTPFEYTGAVLGLVLVFRTNSGHDRWWEARKLWGGIVNQSRNLFITSSSYASCDKAWQAEITKWVIAFSYATKESLRQQDDFEALSDILSTEEIEALQASPHMPVFVAAKIAALLETARFKHYFNDWVFIELEKQRSLLIDYLGGCERILKTPMPLVYVIKARRFILIYLVLLPFSLIDSIGFLSALIVVLVAYPLLSLDRIGFELQNPFALKNLSHLPLDTICAGIKSVGLSLKN